MKEKMIKTQNSLQNQDFSVLVELLMDSIAVIKLKQKSNCDANPKTQVTLPSSSMQLNSYTEHS
jgi:hypothetical protein